MTKNRMLPFFLIRCFLCLFFIGIPLQGMKAQYLPDPLGNGYMFRTMDMGTDYDGKVVATLIRKFRQPDAECAVLYIHGYNDYFFQKQLGDSIQNHGIRFYAVDLRKYGRSLRDWQDAFYCKNLKEYFADLDSALVAIRGEGNSRVALMGHSTGGLVASYYLSRRETTYPVDGLILNSPFLDWNFGGFMEHVAIPTVSFLGRFFPRWKVQGEGGDMYAQSLLTDAHGEWVYDTRWKKRGGHPKRAGWIHAIETAQNYLHRKGAVKCPVLVLSSDMSLDETDEWKAEYGNADLVLDVNDIQRYGVRLGSQVVCDTISGGMHDLILSPAPVRDEVYARMFQWLRSIGFGN